MVAKNYARQYGTLQCIILGGNIWGVLRQHIIFVGSQGQDLQQMGEKLG
jgi:hypothetical protein